MPIYIASLARLHTPHGVPSCVWLCTFLHFLFDAERWVMHIHCLLARLAPFISPSARPHSPCTSAAEQGTPRTSLWRCTRSSLPSRTVTRAPPIVSPCLRGPAGSSKRKNAKKWFRTRAAALLVLRQRTERLFFGVFYVEGENSSQSDQTGNYSSFNMRNAPRRRRDG